MKMCGSKGTPGFALEILSKNVATTPRPPLAVCECVCVCVVCPIELYQDRTAAAAAKQVGNMRSKNSSSRNQGLLQKKLINETKSAPPPFGFCKEVLKA